MITQQEIAQVYALISEIEATKIEVVGMIAENDNCKSSGNAPPYVEADFKKKADFVWQINVCLQNMVRG